jgi:hypothetical protein
MQDGLLDIAVYPDFGKIELLGYYAALMDGGYTGDGKIQRYQARKLKIKTSPKLDVMADGVSLGKGTVTIKVRPNALRVITAGKSPEMADQPESDVNVVPVPVEKQIRAKRGKVVKIEAALPDPAAAPAGNNNHHKESTIPLE